MNSTIEFCIFELAWVPNFNLNWQLWFLDQSCPKRVSLVEKRKSEFHYWILQIWISLGSKFQLKVIIKWLCLAAVHASIFSTRVRPFLIKSARRAFLVWFVNFYRETFLVSFYLILLHLLIQILALEIHSFKTAW